MEKEHTIKKVKSKSAPDCMASKSTTVKTPEGEEVQVNFNMGTGEVTYGPSSCCTGTCPESQKSDSPKQE